MGMSAVMSCLRSWARPRVGASSSAKPANGRGRSGAGKSRSGSRSQSHRTALGPNPVLGTVSQGGVGQLVVSKKMPPPLPVPCINVSPLGALPPLGVFLLWTKLTTALESVEPPA